MAMPRPGGRLSDVIKGLLHPSLRRKRRLLLLVLPALLLRALIPAGFMPLAGAGGAYLGFCPGAGAVPPSASEVATHATHLAHTQLAGGAPHAPGSASHHPACLFSAGATTASAVTTSAALTMPVMLAPAERVASLILLPAILRAQSSRAPPVIA
jgi:predicted DNA repair protein MutK